MYIYFWQKFQTLSETKAVLRICLWLLFLLPKLTSVCILRIFCYFQSSLHQTNAIALIFLVLFRVSYRFLHFTNTGLFWFCWYFWLFLVFSLPQSPLTIIFKAPHKVSRTSWSHYYLVGCQFDYDEKTYPYGECMKSFLHLIKGPGS